MYHRAFFKPFFLLFFLAPALLCPKAAHAQDTPAPTTAVPAGTTRVTITTSRNPSVFGTPVTFTTSVSSGSSGAGVPTGTVTFTDGAATLGTVALSAGKAALTAPGLLIGSHPITAAYGGDAAFGPASAALTQTVTSALSRVALYTSRTPAAFGQAVTFTAAVASASSGAGTPTGAVTFMDAGAALGTVPLSAGKATLVVSSLALGSHSVTAAYGGSTVFGPASASLAQFIRSVTVTTAACPLSPSVFGQAVTLTASVSATPDAPAPTGTVTFLDGATVLGTAALSGGQAAWSGAGLSMGASAVKAVYNGDGLASPSTGHAVQIVYQSASATSLSIPVSAFGSGQPVTLAASVSALAPSVGLPTGAVTFLDQGVSLGSAPLNGGQASLAVPGLSLGSVITAVYGSDANFLESTSAPAGPNAPPMTGIRIMPVGDSITYGFSQDPMVQGGYRGPLWQMTTAQGWQCRYVGYAHAGPPGLGGCEAHLGWNVSNVKAIAPQDVPYYQPDVILLQIGTNSLHSPSDLPSAVTAMASLLDTLIHYAPNAQIVVASLTPCTLPDRDALFTAFNQQLPALVQTRSDAGAKMSFLDMHSLCGFVPADMSDTLHPTASGYAKMANVWYSVLSGLPIPR